MSSASSAAVVSQPPQSDDFLFYAEGVVLTSVATFGLVGTLMSIYVLVQPKVHTVRAEISWPHVQTRPGRIVKQYENKIH